MGLYSKWKDLVVYFVQTQGEDAFWDEYVNVEEDIIRKILINHKKVFSGQVVALSKEFNTSPALFIGVVDGLNTALKNPLNLEDIEEDTEISLDIDFEKLYINIAEADAEELSSLPEWNVILPKEKLAELKLKYSPSKTLVTPEKIGRNEACPCGSGKKYKNCCEK